MWIDQEWILTCSSLTYSILILSILNLNIRVFPLSFCSALCHWKYTWLPMSTSQMSSTSFPSPETWLKSGSGLGPAPSYHLPLNANLAWKNIWNFNQWCSNEIGRAPLGRRGALLFVISFFLSLGTSSSVCAVNEMLLLLWWHIVHQWQWAMWEEPDLLWCG